MILCISKASAAGNISRLRSFGRRTPHSAKPHRYNDPRPGLRPRPERRQPPQRFPRARHFRLFRFSASFSSSAAMSKISDPAGSAPAAGLRVRGLAAGYDGRPVAENISFEIPAGASLAILGESGCGKSTLLSVLAGLAPALRGTLEWTDGDGAAIPKPRSGFVWQHLGLLPWKRVRENLELPLLLGESRASRSEADARTARMLAELGLAGLEDRWPASLSGGQRQRLAIGRALIARPAVLFMDEPFSALDALRREKLQDFLAGLRQRRPAAMIFVTHDIPEAVFLASHILLLGARPSRQIGLFANPAWDPEAQRADRESEVFADFAREIHARLRSASSQHSAEDRS